MPEMTLAEAALWTGKGKPAILKAINRQGVNKLSARQDERGHWHIDPAELARVYPRKPEGTVSGNDDRSAMEQVQDAPGNTREIALLRELADREKARADELAKERDKWQQQAETAQADAREAHARLDRLLPYHPQQTTPEATETPSGQGVATMAQPGQAGAMPAGRHGLLRRLGAAIRG